jgi:hypothetical protein
MIYQPFPSLGELERLKHSNSFTQDTKLLPLNQLLPEKNESPVRATLLSVLGEPYLWWQSPGQDKVSVIHAGSGKPARFDSEQVRAIARQFYPQKLIQSIQPPVEYDQWIVANRFDPFRPFYRVDFADTQGTSIYVSSRNAQVLQQTTQSQRRWNYVGAVVHWIYPTIIRKHWALWDQLVWWLALTGMIGVLSGLTLGVVRTCRVRGGWSNFSGWLHWHHLGGLGAGVLILGWIFSGWLSMDHGRLFSVPDPTSEQLQAFHGTTLSMVTEGLPSLETVLFSNVSEIELRIIAGEPYLLSKSPTADYQTWLLNKNNQWQQHKDGLPHPLLHEAITSAWTDLPLLELSEIESDDVYAHLREGEMAPSVLRAVLGESARTWVHVDKISGEIVSVMDSSRRVYRWLFNGLHSLDVPALTSRPSIWKGVMLGLLGMGALFSLTGVVLGMRRLFR